MKLYPNTSMMLFLSIFTYNLANAQNFVPSPFMGNNGVVTIDVAAGFDEMIAHHLMPDGKLLLGGGGNDPGCNCSHISFVRMDTLCGALDPTFGNAGKIDHRFIFSSLMRDMAVLPDGRILAVGQNAPDNSLSQAVNSVYRFNADGTLDLSFNGTGWRTDRFDAVSSGINHSILPLPDGRIYTVGTSTFNINGGALGIGVMRYLENGSLDNSYSGDGKAWVAMTAPLANIGGHTALLLPDESVLWIGFGQVAGQTRKVHFAKFDSTGILDSDFGLNGQLTTTLELSDNNQQTIRASLLPDGRMLIGAKSINNQYMIARFLSTGSLDSTYGVNGVSLVDPTPNNDSPYSFQILESGNTIQFGGENAVTGFSMVKRTPDGLPDATFGNNGIVQIPLLNQNGQSIRGGLMLSNRSAIAYGGGTTNTQVALAIKMVDNPSLGQFADLGPDIFACEGNEVVLDAGFSGSSYIWAIDNLPSAITDQTITVETTASYSVTITNNAGCTDSDTVEVQFVSYPPEPQIIFDENQLYTTAVGDFQWFLNGEAIDGANEDIFTFQVNGIYTVSVTNSAGCSTMSAPYEVTTVEISNSIISNKLLIVYPNPANDLIFIEPRFLSNNKDLFTISIMDIKGREVLKKTFNGMADQKSIILNVENLLSGTYLLVLQDNYGETRAYKQFVKQ